MCLNWTKALTLDGTHRAARWDVVWSRVSSHMSETGTWASPTFGRLPSHFWTGSGVTTIRLRWAPVQDEMSVVIREGDEIPRRRRHDRSSKHPCPARAYIFAMRYLREVHSRQPVQIRAQSRLQSLPVHSLRYSHIFRDMPVQRISWKTFEDAWPMRTVLCGHPPPGACRSGR